MRDKEDLFKEALVMLMEKMTVAFQQQNKRISYLEDDLRGMQEAIVILESKNDKPKD